MILSVPVLIERVDRVHSIRALFAPQPQESHRDLGRCTSRFVSRLREILIELGRQDRHDELSLYSFSPRIEERKFELGISLRKRVVRCRMLFVAFAWFDRRVVFNPRLPGLSFTVERGQDLAQRAEEFLTAHFRKLEREQGKDAARPEDCAMPGAAWVTTVDLDFTPPRRARKRDEAAFNPFAALGGHSAADGAYELNRVGRCLDWLYPEGLLKAFCRDREVAELSRVIDGAHRRPVLLVGPQRVGKTAVIHEHVRRSLEKRGGRFTQDHRFWLLSPQRLISGMSYVGQWEERVLAILAECKKRKHVLVFDDLLGLYQAGVSSESSLCIAHVLKPYVERRDVAVLAEMSPEAFRVLQEIDRGFADLFHVLRINEPAAADTLTILVRLQRELEGKHKNIFHPGVLPRVLSLQRRYARGLAFPGKAAVFLERLAVKFAEQLVSPEQVLSEFTAVSGLSMEFLDERSVFERSAVIQDLSQRVIGQGQAIAAMADAVVIGKARLSDPTRPLGSFLFLGPTGVGKTECAKSLAAHLFGSPERLVRFDMNEYSGPDASARLLGTFDRPEGQLTSAVAQNPFCVLLLDEIEKAHPDVFDLLLQVLDDGRLTDAHGRTTDFTCAIVILTSNLGASEAQRSLGFGAAEAPKARVYSKAAEGFFRPEFMNRLDRVIPFDRLSRADVRTIAEKAIQAVFAREGLARRRCILDVQPGVLERVADQGFEPELGARALKRAIERSIARPVAARLAGLRPERPTIVSLESRGAAIAVQVAGLRDAPRVDMVPAGLSLDEPGATLAGLTRALDRLDERLEAYRPDETFAPERLQPDHHLYFDLGDQLRWLRRKLDDWSEILASRPAKLVRPLRGPRLNTRLRLCDAKQPASGELFALSDMRAYLREASDSAEVFGAEFSQRLLGMVQRVALLDVATAPGPGHAGERAGLRVEHVGGRGAGRQESRPQYLQLIAASMSHQVPLELLALEDDLVVFEGPRVSYFLGLEAGCHLFWAKRGGFHLLRVQVVAVDESLSAMSAPETNLALPLSGTKPASPIAEALVEVLPDEAASPLHEALREALPGDGEAESPWPPVIRIYDEQGTVLDLPTGLLCRAAWPEPDDLRAMLLGRLPWPEELTEGGS